MISSSSTTRGAKTLKAAIDALRRSYEAEAAASGEPFSALAHDFEQSLSLLLGANHGFPKDGLIVIADGGFLGRVIRSEVAAVQRGVDYLVRLQAAQSAAADRLGLNCAREDVREQFEVAWTAAEEGISAQELYDRGNLRRKAWISRVDRLRQQLVGDVASAGPRPQLDAAPGASMTGNIV